MVKILLMAIASAVLGGTAYIFEVSFSYADLKDYCNTLFALSGLIFTIMGIWIAFVYPNAIKRLQDPDKIIMADFTATMNDTRRLESIVGAVMESGFVALSITIFYLIKMILSGLPFYEGLSGVFKYGSLTFIFFLTFIQFSSVFSVIHANYLFIDELHTRREVQERNNDVS